MGLTGALPDGSLLLDPGRTSSVGLAIRLPMDNTDLLPNGVSAWWLALRDLRPGLAYADLVGLTATSARTAYGPSGTPPLADTGSALADRLPALGFRGRPVEAPALRRAPTWGLGRGWPVVAWFASGREGIVTGAAGTGRLAGIEVGPAGLTVREFEIEDLAEASVLAVGLSREGAGRAGRRAGTALLEWATAAWRPVRPAALRTAGEPAPATGLAAYSTWAAHLDAWAAQAGRQRRPAAASRRSPECPSGASEGHFRARCWLDARRAGLEFARGLAGSQRRPYAVRLRRALPLLEWELAELAELVEALAPGTREHAAARADRARAAADRLRSAANAAREGTALIAEAALLRLHVPDSVSRVLLEPPEAPLEGMGLREMVYLARAGIVPLRQLAARRLQGSDDHQAMSTLSQLLWYPDAAVVDTAAWALDRIGTPAARRALAEYRRQRDERRAAEEAGEAGERPN